MAALTLATWGRHWHTPVCVEVGVLVVVAFHGYGVVVVFTCAVVVVVKAIAFGQILVLQRIR